MTEPEVSAPAVMRNYHEVLRNDLVKVLAPLAAAGDLEGSPARGDNYGAAIAVHAAMEDGVEGAGGGSAAMLDHYFDGAAGASGLQGGTCPRARESARGHGGVRRRIGCVAQPPSSVSGPAEAHLQHEEDVMVPLVMRLPNPKAPKFAEWCVSAGIAHGGLDALRRAWRRVPRDPRQRQNTPAVATRVWVHALKAVCSPGTVGHLSSRRSCRGDAVGLGGRRRRGPQPRGPALVARVPWASPPALRLTASEAARRPCNAASRPAVVLRVARGGVRRCLPQARAPGPDVRRIEEWLPSLLRGRRILEIACGTGYWTQFLAPAAAGIVASTARRRRCESRASACRRQTYRSPWETRTRPSGTAGRSTPPSPASGSLTSRRNGRPSSSLRSTVAAARSEGRVPRQSVRRRQLFADSERDERGNTYQSRRLSDGSVHRVLKNFPSETQLHALVANGLGCSPRYTRWSYFWAFEYRVPAKSVTRQFAEHELNRPRVGVDSRSA